MPAMNQNERHEPIRFSRVLPLASTPSTATTMSFVVRISRRPGGEVTGIVERVATGQKVRFEGCEAVSSIIAQMLEMEEQ